MPLLISVDTTHSLTHRLRARSGASVHTADSRSQTSKVTTCSRVCVLGARCVYSFTRSHILSTLHHTTPHYTTPHHTAPHYTTPHHTALHHTPLHHTTPHHTTLLSRRGVGTRPSLREPPGAATVPEELVLRMHPHCEGQTPHPGETRAHRVHHRGHVHGYVCVCVRK
jgi:hypothetical protein